MNDKQTALLIAYLASIEESLRVIAEAVRKAQEAVSEDA